MVQSKYFHPSNRVWKTRNLSISNSGQYADVCIFRPFTDLSNLGSSEALNRQLIEYFDRGERLKKTLDKDYSIVSFKSQRFVEPYCGLLFIKRPNRDFEILQIPLAFLPPRPEADASFFKMFSQEARLANEKQRQKNAAFLLSELHSDETIRMTSRTAQYFGRIFEGVDFPFKAEVINTHLFPKVVSDFLVNAAFHLSVAYEPSDISISRQAPTVGWTKTQMNRFFRESISHCLSKELADLPTWRLLWHRRPELAFCLVQSGFFGTLPGWLAIKRYHQFTTADQPL